MCGITGWVDFKKPLVREQSIMEKMTDTLSNRGPDDTNIWGKRHVLFGHKRLAVVDLEGGRQPMTRTHQGYDYTICYNGELYNTEDLRKELRQRGHQFKSHSDTEVLLHSYMEWKEECIDRLNGIFAFTVWDEKRDLLFAARDRLGVKPFFYTEQGSSFLFGSEIKAILAHPEVKAKVDRSGLAEIFGLGPSRSPGSGVFKGIKEIRPGHAMIFSKDGLTVWRYWNVKSEKHTDSFDETVENVRSLFQDAVTRQLVSDVPVCTFLSGGVDSSAITATAAKHFEKEGKAPLHTFSIDYEDNEQYFTSSSFQPNADGPWIKKMSNAFETVHHNCVISQEELADYLEEAVLVRDLPGMADVDSSLLWFCREIKKDFVVSLSGECADEIFGGYPWFHSAEDVKGFPWMRSMEERNGLLQDGWQKKLNLSEYVKAKYEETVKETPLLEGETGAEKRRRELFYLNMLWFMTTLLDRKDRMSMGASLEVRVPFADHRLVEYVWNIPWDVKMHGNREKGIFRKALEGILPDEVLYRKKSPYPKTHHPAYTKAVIRWLESLLEQKDSALYVFLDKKKLERLIETEGASFQVPWYGQLMKGPQLIAHLGQIHTWFENYRIDIEE
ncbi:MULTISPECIES: asparagine synthase (glutamine-hydrolyzing) [Bacillus]|uniref:asparagine synthase (glutamine-hydrolyzing) n=1 Tax=Bacillus TaxID=1386 RepID=UPI002244923F|nr:MULTISPECIES: asparagine synthase (glutamine-hydrolyzing) [Bacillus]MDN5388247.1 asparagine synthase (glutamine-hydrolyzing) [Bacillus sp. LB7]MEC1020761.1 asparagine synthase (glutamine-hydrolyzing) [Bacillus paralicheniformis]MEC1025893.1 asparagine synthase (glutamine-hydrolyzing) [Bacillus paralicheniformis]MEC1036400.1 asparagine synthase (glutamine-hydrolyzing) [Bacillus paralicheniformis]MEC1050809.1 asparagine synthase (glutamine-hydrolyzing) [Bacillus paralicheniformis]